MKFRNTFLSAAISALSLASITTSATANAAAANPETLVSSGGEVIRPTAREAAGGGGASFRGTDPVPESVIGSDGRSRITPTTSYPSRAIVYVTRNGASETPHCTAEFIGKDTLLTAGHCVHTGGSSGNWYSGLRFYPARDGSTKPYPYCVARNGGLYSITGWTQNKDEKHDIGIVKLSCTTGSKTGWFGWWWQSASQKGYSSTVRGYPGDKPAGTMWSMDGTVAVSETYQNFYSIDTFGGQSGSPVYQNRRSGSSFCSGYCIHTNHSYGQHASSTHKTYNHGRRITQAVSDLMSQVKAQA